MEKKNKPIENSEKNTVSTDNFDMELKQVPFKIFKRNDKEKEYSAKEQKRKLTRILSKEEINCSLILPLIDQVNEAYGYEEEIVAY